MRVIKVESLQSLVSRSFKGCRMGRSDKVSLWYVALLTLTVHSETKSNKGK